MSQSHMDWKTELKKVERAFDGLPPEPSPGEKRARQAAEQREQLRRKERHASLGAWARLSLVMILAVGINLWPYAHSCGMGLFSFLAAEVLIVAGGAWVALVTWRERLGMIHGVALLVTLWGLALLELQVLPRIGYAKTDANTPAVWWCPASE